VDDSRLRPDCDLRKSHQWFDTLVRETEEPSFSVSVEEFEELDKGGVRFADL
jgi:hypothetical protein